MKHRKLTLVCGIAAASVLAVSATAMASQGWTPEAESAPAADVSETTTTTTVEMDSETGEVIINGEPAGNLGDIASELDEYVVTMNGEDGEIVCLNPKTGESFAYSAVDESEIPMAEGDTVYAAKSAVEINDETGEILQDGKVIGHIVADEDGSGNTIALEDAQGEQVYVTSDDMDNVSYRIVGMSDDGDATKATFVWKDNA